MTRIAERKAPTEINDMEELRREMRIALMSGDEDRRKMLEKRRDQWRKEHAEEIEAASDRQKQREAEEMETWKRYEAEPLLMNEYLAKRNAQCNQSNAEKRAKTAEYERDRKTEEALKQKQRAERAEKGQTSRRVSFADTTLAQKPKGHEYTPEDFCEALKWDNGRLDAVRRAVRTWGKGSKRGSRWSLTRDQAEAFWLWHKQSRHEKPHPPRRQQNSAQIARGT